MSFMEKTRYEMEHQEELFAKRLAEFKSLVAKIDKTCDNEDDTKRGETLPS